ncbi:hypothetical protein GH714_021746 [Hevea brasiliensis]|uniref:Uncharacterized protein n=1 Tax=Hevea brasiliensis TaxID=3981 RepID=A0A6A6N1M8_HEVBR|nr:hypothetical protein GH714_021746 [Hevea brasiliensis]
MSEQSEFADRSGEKPSQQSQPGLAGFLSGTLTPLFTRLQESQEGEQKAIMFEKFHSENPLLLNVCRTLFPANHKYVWSGPRALVQREGSRRRSCIDAAIEILMK